MKIKISQKTLTMIKIAGLLLTSIILALITKDQPNEIIKPGYLLNYLSILFGFSLAILAIFFSLIEKYKKIIEVDKFETFFIPIINDFSQDVISYFFMMVFVVIVSFCNLKIVIDVFSLKMNLDDCIFIFILLLSLLVLWDLLKTTIILIEGIMSNEVDENQS